MTDATSASDVEVEERIRPIQVESEGLGRVVENPDGG